MTYAIETFDMTKRFTQKKRNREILKHPFRRKEVTVLDKVSIKVKGGELSGILGPNGAGKTTLIKLLSTLILPDAGTAYVNGYNIVEDAEKVRSSIGLITNEERSFYWRLTGRQNLHFFASLHNFSSLEAKNRINTVIKLVNLEDRVDDRFHNYSTGMKHRMSIARGLLHDPEILFMDEPTLSLDPYAAQQIRAFIKENLVRGQGKTVFLSTHNMQEAEKLCDRLVIINQGKIVAQGALKEFQGILGTELITMEVKDISNEILDQISDLEEVNSLNSSSERNIIILEIHTTDSKNILSQIVEMIVNAGGKIRDCNTSVSDLNYFFTEFIGERDGI